MNQTHECSACEGTGRRILDTKVRRIALGEMRYNDVIEACPVCLGSGRISDVTPVADALADAETLQGMYDIPLSIEDALNDCEDFGDIVIRSFDGPMPWVVQTASQFQLDELRIDFARLAARAAFRAVPDLRNP